MSDDPTLPDDQMPERRVVELNALGRAAVLGEAAVRVTATLMDKIIDRAAQITADSIHAFEQGRDPNIQDAKILEERVFEERKA